MNQPRAAVIGSGFGGLTLAVRLQSAGIATTVIEKRDKEFLQRLKTLYWEQGSSALPEEKK